MVVGAGTFEAPYKTMGQFDSNMDTALALNAHGGFSQGQGGLAGNFEGALLIMQMVQLNLAYVRQQIILQMMSQTLIEVIIL